MAMFKLAKLSTFTRGERHTLVPSKDRERLEIYREVQRNLRQRLKLTAEAAGPWPGVKQDVKLPGKTIGKP